MPLDRIPTLNILQEDPLGPEVIPKPGTDTHPWRDFIIKLLIILAYGLYYALQHPENLAKLIAALHGK